MKQILLILLPAMLLISCERHYLLSADEVPGWLKTRIAEIEDGIRTNCKEFIWKGPSWTDANDGW